ncbi:hypothetical protein [Halobaculum limi]|uniref:hypothetical protein n=1 Tax=Halobaculum limi TaxID=3031916 RepID=UPI0024074D5C|nr:hypothetical protein [Halobaculum sp. YSMS11]
MDKDALVDHRADAQRRAVTPPLQVTALRTTPDRTVFSEDGNADGWISTDLTVTPEQ